MCVSEVQVGLGRGEIRPLSPYPLTLGWAADECREGIAPVEVGGRRD